MRQYSKVLQRCFGVVLVVIMLFSFVGCDDNTQDNGEAGTPTEEPVVMTINGYPITKSVYTIKLYEAAVNLKMEAEPEQELTDEEYQEWFFNFYNIEIDGRMPFDIVRENVMDNLKEYAYYMQAVQNAGITMSEADKNDIETNVLITVGEEYDPEHPDDYFNYTYGVTKDQYVEYLVSEALINTYVTEMAAKETISQESIDAYLDAYRSHYTVWTIQNIFLAATTEDEFSAKEAFGEQLAQRVQNGEDMTSMVKQYSEDGSGGDGIFTVSDDISDYPYNILDWVHLAQANQVGVVRAEDGVYVLKCVAMDVDANATTDIQSVLGIEQFKQKVTTACQSDDYEPVLNDAVYNAFTKLPGDLMMSDEAVG